MTRIHHALFLGCVLLVVAVLAVFDIIPEAIAQYAPLAVVPFIVSRQASCRFARKGAAA